MRKTFFSNLKSIGVIALICGLGFAAFWIEELTAQRLEPKRGNYIFNRSPDTRISIR
jgi:hypothetical protein